MRMFEGRRKGLRLAAYLLILVLLVPCVPYTGVDAGAATAGVKGVVTATELYMRNGPGTTYDNILHNGEKALLVKDQEVLLYALVDEWYFLRAEMDGEVLYGYSLGKYFTAEKEFEQISLADFVGNSDSTMPDISRFSVPDSSGNADAQTGEKDNEARSRDNRGYNEDGSIPEGYEEVVKDCVSKFDLTGTVTRKLNLRSTSDIESKVLGVLEKDQKVWLVGTCIKKQNIDGSDKKVRWYRVLALVDGKLERGYALSDYISLTYDSELRVVNKYGKQVLYKNVGSKRRVKTVSGKSIVRLPKNSVLTVLEEVQTDDYKWLKVSAEYKGEVYEGYIKSLRTDYIRNATKTVVRYLVPKEQDANVNETPIDVVINPDTPATDGNEQGVTAENPPAKEVEGANARIAGAAALSVKTEPRYQSAALFTSDGKPVFLYTDDLVRVTDETADSEGNYWYHIDLLFDGNTYSGYINRNYVVTDSRFSASENGTDPVLTELTFEQQLEKEGFPESYREPLRLLHEKYPSWKFQAYHTGLEWNQVIAAESEVGVNLIPNTKSVEWKSLEKGAYSWKTDTFTVFDGSSWVTASQKAIEYYMDPRNFLDEDTIFQFEVLTYYPSFQKLSGVEKILKNTAMNGKNYEYKDESGITRTISYADTFIMAAEYSGVSPLHLASRVKQEVTIGANAMSNSVTGTVSGLEGLYNYYNIGAYHSTEAGGAIANGLRFALNGSSSESLNLNCLIPWNNRLRSIMGGGFYIGNNYINRGQNTIYLQKFNVTSSNSFWHQYMANVEAPYSEGKRVFTAYEDPAGLPIVFSIPVYLGMPEAACPVPEKEYNPNNWLKSLTLYDINGEKLSLTPGFSYTEDIEYSIIVPNNIDYIKLGTKTVSTKATVTSDGYVYPDVGMNRFAVTVKAENGEVREYIINIVREAADTEPTGTPEPTAEPTGTPEPTAEPTGTPEPTTEPTGTPEPTGVYDPAMLDLSGIPTPELIILQ